MDFPPNNTSADSDTCSLPELWRCFIARLNPKIAAYIIGLFLLCIFELGEVRLAQAWEHSIPPVPPDTRIAPERQTLVPNPDGLRWIIYTQKSIEDGTFRIERTVYGEGYSEGHFIGWSSLPMWWLKGMAWVRHVITGQPLVEAVPDVAIYYNNVLWIVAALFMGPMLISVFGWRGAFAIPLMAAVLSPLSYSNRYGIFSPDHHLWILLAALGTVVCLAAPFVKEGNCRARRWFIAGAAFVAMGIWLSAASEALVLVGIFLGFLFIPTDVARRVDSAGWRWFGYVGALLSIGLCWMEYGWVVPYYFEDNSPMFAGGVFVSGLLFWQAHEFAASGRQWSALNGRVVMYSILGLVIVAVPFLLYYHELFSLADPIHSRWVDMVVESRPFNMWAFVMNNMFFPLAVIFCAGSLFYGGMDKSRRNLSLYFLGGLIVLFGYLGLSHTRFFDFTLMALCLSVVVVIDLRKTNSWGVVAAGLLAFSGLEAAHGDFCNAQYINSGKSAGNMPTYAQIRYSAQHLLAATDGKARVLCDPGCGNLVNYYSKMPVFGTGYWENKDALTENCRIFFYERSTPVDSWQVVQSKLRRAGIRYILARREFDYTLSYSLYGRDLIRDPSFTFAYYLSHVSGDKTVPWLRLAGEDDMFRLFEVRSR